MKALAIAVLLFGLAVDTSAAAKPKVTKAAQKAQVLTVGEYSAKVKAIVCSGCVPIIEKTMREFPGIESGRQSDGGHRRQE